MAPRTLRRGSTQFKEHEFETSSRSRAEDLEAIGQPPNKAVFPNREKETKATKINKEQDAKYKHQVTCTDQAEKSRTSEANDVKTEEKMCPEHAAALSVADESESCEVAVKLEGISGRYVQRKAPLRRQRQGREPSRRERKEPREPDHARYLEQTKSTSESESQVQSEAPREKRVQTKTRFTANSRELQPRKRCQTCLKYERQSMKALLYM